MAREIPDNMTVASMYIFKKDLAFLVKAAKKLKVTKSQYIRDMIAAARENAKKK
jgi:hypothetical protein